MQCGWCGIRGHNKRTCPKFEEYVKKNPSTYSASSYRRMKEKTIVRECSWCHTQGHNRATCKTLFTDKIQAIVNNKTFRKEALAFIKEYKIGPGTMLGIPTYDYSMPEGSTKQKFLLIQEIKWDEINYQNSRNSLICTTVGDKSYSGDDNIRLTQSFMKKIKEGKYSIVTSAMEKRIAIGIPNNWLSGTSGMAVSFPDGFAKK
jgi:hypothetical protein